LTGIVSRETISAPTNKTTNREDYIMAKIKFLELLLHLDKACMLTRRQAIYLAENTAIVNKLLTYHAQGKVEAMKAILEEL
jgi:hypothetical protein